MCALALVAGCRSTVEYNPVDRDVLLGRPVLTLPTSRVPPMPKALVTEADSAYRQTLIDSPYLGEVTTTDEFLAAIEGEFALRERYRTITDTLSALRLVDREFYLQLQQRTGASLLAMVQVLDLPCPGCDQGNRVGLIAALYEADTARLVWRLHLTEDIPDAPIEADYQEAVGELTARMATMLNRLLAPKWHRDRFTNLKTRAAS